MNAKHERFVAEYLIDLNGKQAAIRSGYSPRCAEVQACRLLRNAQVAEAVAVGKARQLDAAELSAITTLRAIQHQVVGDIRTLFDEHGKLRPITSLSFGEAALIAGFEVIVKNAEAGDGHTDIVHKVKLKDQARFVEMAAKHFGLLVDKIEHSGGIDIAWKDSE